ncbi:MFS transporter [Candidatus Woesebacteria bacterium]|nr:MFS transporter [Candidatus Woesebacteria bacterium]
MFYFRSLWAHISLSFDSGKEMRTVYTLRFLRDLVNVMGYFFLPIFLFETGKKMAIFSQFDLNDFQTGMITIALFFITERLVVAMTAIPVGKLITKIGFNKAILVSVVLRAGFFGSLIFLEKYPLLFICAAFFEGLQGTFFWPSYFSLFSKHTRLGSVGKDLGMLQFGLQLLNVFVPAISGYIAFLFGFPALFGVVLCLSLITVILVLNMHSENTRDEISLTEFREWWQTEPEFVRLVTSATGKYLNDSVLFLWPLYVFSILGNVERVGYLYTFSLFLALLTIYFVGAYVDQAKNRKSFLFSGGFLSLTWLVRTQFLSIWGLAIIDAFEKLVANVHWLFYEVMTMHTVKGSQVLSYFVYREMVLSIAAVLFWLVFGIFFWYGHSWNMLFILGAIGVVLSMRMRGHHNETK